MKDIVFYKNVKGKSQVYDYICAFKGKNDKNSRINWDKIHDYLNALKYGGKSIGYPYIKYLGDKIWELRPLDNSILFF